MHMRLSEPCTGSPAPHTLQVLLGPDARRDVANSCGVLCCAVLCCAVLCCAVLCCAVFAGEQLPDRFYERMVSGGGDQSVLLSW